MKQTAVEWLHNQLHLNISLYQDEWQIIEGLMEQAKEREKEQIIEAWNVRAKIDGVLTYTDNRTAEQYYEQTFNKSINDKG
jgi:hypothetical protein